MKYIIDGIEVGETIVSHRKTDTEALEVNYMDGTSDFYPARKEFAGKVNSVMEEQATTYVNSGRDKKLEKTKVGYTICSLVSGGSLLASAHPVVTGIITSEPNVVAVGASVVCAGALLVSLIKRGSAKKELDYIKKLKMFLENKELINSKYSAIKEAEASLGVDEGFRCININNVDRVPLDKMEEAISKCKRYPVIDKTPFQKHL